MPLQEATREDLEREGAYFVLYSSRDEPSPGGGTVAVMQEFRVSLDLLTEVVSEPKGESKK